MIEVHGFALRLRSVGVDQHDLGGQPAEQQGAGKGRTHIAHADHSDAHRARMFGLVSSYENCLQENVFSEDIRLTLIDRPIAFSLIAKLQQSILGVVTLRATGTLQIAAPGRALTIVVFGNGEGSAATAGDEKHLE